MSKRSIRAIASFLFVASFAFASKAPARGVHVVDDSGGADFTSISDAVAAAASGDTILVKSGGYTAPTIDGKALVLISDTAAVVTLTGTMVIQNIAAGQSVTVRGFSGSSSTGPGLRVSSCLGPVTIERCSFNGGNAVSLYPGIVFEAHAGALLQTCDSVAFAKTTLIGGDGIDLDDEDIYSWAPDGGAGLKATSSRVSASWSILEGGDGASINDTTSKPGGDGGSGANLTGGFLFAAGCTFRGGKGGHGDCDQPFGGCGSGGTGGSGILLSAGSPVVRVLDCEYFPGTGSFGGNGQPAPDGQAISGAGDVVTLPGDARTYGASSPVREGGTLILAFAGVPGEIVGVLYAPAPESFLYVESWSGTVIPSLAIANAISPGTLAADGTLVAGIPLGALPPTVEGLTFHTQAFFVAPDLSAVVLGPFASVTWLDGTL